MSIFKFRHDYFHHYPDLIEVKARIAELRGLMIQLLEKDMATKENLDALTNQVAANTDAVASAKMALEGYVKSNEDLTKRLQDALASDDDAAVKAAVDAIAANNNTLRNAIPVVAAAVPQNTG